MNKSITRFVSILLCALLIVSIVPSSRALAADNSSGLRISNDWCPKVLNDELDLPWYKRAQAYCYSVENQAPWSKLTIGLATTFIPAVAIFNAIIEEDYKELGKELLSGGAGKLAGKVISWKSEYQIANNLYSRITPDASDFATIAARQREIENTLDAINNVETLNRMREANEKLGNLTELYGDLSDMSQAKRGNIILRMLDKAFTYGYYDPNNIGSLGLYSINFEYGKYIPKGTPVSTKLLDIMTEDFSDYLTQGSKFQSKYEAETFLNLAIAKKPMSYAEYKQYEKDALVISKALQTVLEKQRQNGHDLIALADKYFTNSAKRNDAIEIYKTVANGADTYGTKNAVAAAAKLVRANKTVPDTTPKPVPSPAPVQKPVAAPTLSTSSKPVLAKDRNNDAAWVKLLQDTLRDKKYFFDVSDGDFGKITDTSVRLFQIDNNLDADGIVGNNTWAALAKSDPYQRIQVQINGKNVGGGFKIGNDSYLPKSALDALDMPANFATATNVGGINYYMWYSTSIPLDAISIGNGGYNFKTAYSTVKVVVNGKGFKSAFMVNGSAYLESSVLDLLGVKYTGTEKVIVKNYTYIKWNALKLNYKSIDGGFSFTKK